MLLGLGFLCKLYLSFRFLYKDYEFFSKCILAASLYCLELIIVAAIAGTYQSFNVSFLSQLLIASFTLNLVAIVALNKRHRDALPKLKQRYSIASVLVILLITIFYLPPSQIVIGGQDPSVYVGAAATLARNEQASITLAAHKLLSAQERVDWLKFREKPTQHNWPYGGIYVFNDDAPQFQFDFARGPSYLLALGFVATKAAHIWEQRAFITNTIYCVLAIFCFFLFLQEFLESKVWAFLATLLLLFCPAEIWFGRATYSEVPAQFFLFLSLLHLILLEKRQVIHRYAFLGIALIAAATSFLMRTDHISILLLLLVCLPFFKARSVIAPRLIFFAQCVVFGLFFLATYEMQATGPLYLWRMGRMSIVLKEMPWFVCAGMLFSLLFYFAKAQSLFSTCYALAQKWLRSKLALVLFSFAILCLLGWGFIYRPYFVEFEHFGPNAAHNAFARTMNEAIFKRLAVLVGLPIFLLSFWGMRSYFIKHKESFVTCIVLLLVIAYCSQLLISQKNSPMLYWASRRYLPMLIPFFITFGIYQLSQLQFSAKSSLNQSLKALLYLAAIVPMWVVGQPMFWIGEMNGALSVVNELQRRLDPKKTVLIADRANNHESFPLQFLAGYEVLLLDSFKQRTPDEISRLAKRLQQADFDVALISAKEAGLDLFATLPATTQGTIVGPYYRLGENMDRFPDTQTRKDYRVTYQLLAR